MHPHQSHESSDNAIGIGRNPPSGTVPWVANANLRRSASGASHARTGKDSPSQGRTPIAAPQNRRKSSQTHEILLKKPSSTA
jgi:hypothetical protein